MDKSLLSPTGPLGSIVIGIVLLVLGVMKIHPGGIDLTWLGLAFLLGGLILFMVRIMNKKNTELPR